MAILNMYQQTAETYVKHQLIEMERRLICKRGQRLGRKQDFVIIPEGPVNIYITLSNKTARTFLSQISMDHFKIKYIMDHKIQFYFGGKDPKYIIIFFSKY